MKVTWVLLKAEALTAVAIPRRFEAGNLYESQMEIPGTTVRGAFAAAYLNSGKPVNEEFRRLFENQKVRFGPLRPLPQNVKDLPDFIPVMPVPKSARSCKYDDGLQEEGHGVLDFLFEASAESPEKRKELTCHQCGAPIEPLEKPWLVVNWKQEFGVDYKPDFRLNTHVGIGAIGTREMEVAMEGRLFSLQCFPQGTKFSGWIAITDGDADSLLKNLGFEKRDGEVWQLSFHLRVGRRSSTYGALEVEAQVSDNPPWDQTHGCFDERWKNFQKGFWQRLGSPENLRLRSEIKQDFVNGYVFSITFITDTILLDQFLRPYRILTPEEVAKRLEIPEDKVQLLASFSRHQIIRGWNNAHRLPKEQDLAISVGSVFLFIVQKDAVGEDALKQKLRAWEENGIGWRRNEGFGQVLICDPWHVRQSTEELVPLHWKKTKGKREAKGFEKEIVEFVTAIESKAPLTKTQLERFKTLAHIIDSTFRHQSGMETEFHPCQRLKQYLQHQKERRISGWGEEVLWKNKNVTVADALIDVLNLDACDWKTSLERLNQFVQLMLASIAGKSLHSEFKMSERIRRG